jgi:hypothetical protein
MGCWFGGIWMFFFIKNKISIFKLFFALILNQPEKVVTNDEKKRLTLILFLSLRG